MCCLFFRLVHKQLCVSIVKKEIGNIIQQKRTTFAVHNCVYQFHREVYPESRLFPKVLNNQRNITSMTKEENLFQGLPDRYDGLTVDSTKEQCDISVFTEKLKDSLIHWIGNNVRGLWFKVALDQADWVPILAKNGFVFHHAQTEYVMMHRWLPTTEDSNIPCFAHTMVGVGAVVVNNTGDILVVRERHHVKGYPFWKLPGGYVDAGEDLEDAAKREVLEETGIETKFNFVVAFRHTHGVNFECSDMYFIVNLTPVTEVVTKCDREIVDCQWMKINEYLEHPQVHEGNRFFLRKYLECKNSGKIIDSFKGTHPILKRPYTVFSIDDVKTNECGGKEKSKM